MSWRTCVVVKQMQSNLLPQSLQCCIQYHVDGLVQDCSNSRVLAMELLQSCTKPSLECHIGPYNGRWLYSEKGRDDSLMSARIPDDTWNVLNMQHITPNSKWWGYWDNPQWWHLKRLMDPHWHTWFEGGHHLRNRPQPPSSLQCAKF